MSTHTHALVADRSPLSDHPTLIQVYESSEDAEPARKAVQKGNLPEYTNPRVMTMDEYDKLHREHWLDAPGDLTGIDAETYMDALEVLPPESWETSARFDRFCMMEYTSGPITRQYARAHIDGEWVHVHRMVNGHNRDTWITYDEVRDFARDAVPA